MENQLKIKLFFLKIFCLIQVFGQADQGLIPMSNRLLYNPSYAGYNNYMTIQTNNIFTTLPDRNLKHNYTLSYDTWSNHLQGGVGVKFFNALHSEGNIINSGIGLIYARPIKLKKDNSLIIPSFNLNGGVVIKHWYVLVIDELMAHKTNFFSKPGRRFYRDNLINPAIGLLRVTQKYHLGVSGSYSVIIPKSVIPSSEDEEKRDDYKYLSDYHLLLHYSRKNQGNHHGLQTSPYESGPEFMMLLTTTRLNFNAGYHYVNMQHNYGIYLLGELPSYSFGLAALYGWKKRGVRLNITSGITQSVLNSKIKLYGEINLGLQIPCKNYIKENAPWIPVKKEYP